VALEASLFLITYGRMVFHCGYKNDERQARNFAEEKPSGPSFSEVERRARAEGEVNLEAASAAV